MARYGNSGRIPDSKRDEYDAYRRVNITLPPEIAERMKKYCEDDERAKSWVIAKALDMWLATKGY